MSIDPLVGTETETLHADIAVLRDLATAMRHFSAGNSPAVETLLRTAFRLNLMADVLSKRNVSRDRAARTFSRIAAPAPVPVADC